jgi:uncharacterized membrane protein
MSSSTRPPDLGTVGTAPPGYRIHGAGLLRLALVVAYPLLSHLAGSHRGDGRFAALALADIVLIVLLRPLLERRAGAWGLLVVLLAGLAWLAGSRFAMAPLLLVPAAILAAVAWTFARTLRSVPLITRMVAGLDRIPAAELSPELLRYTRNLTRSWAMLLALLAVFNLLLALLEVPGGLLAMSGIGSPLVVDQARWSWFAGVFNVGLMIGFFLVEFAIRQRRFPGRYASLLDFLRQMARLGPEFWRGVAH